MTTIGRGAGVGQTIQTAEIDDQAVTAPKLGNSQRGKPFGCGALLQAAATCYIHPQGYTDASLGGFGAVSVVSSYVMPRAGSIRQLRSVLRTALGAGETVVVTVFINGVASALTVTHPALAAANDAQADTVNEPVAALGDRITIQVVSTDAGINGVAVSGELKFT
ncbi:MAG: hypothetical protein QOG31_1405 [Thermoplasmata archaeon]|nr:hypothetical protein [Thermoplasmata archaeon]